MDEVGPIRMEFLRVMLRPLVRFCLRGSNSIQDFIDVLKVVFVEVAEEEIRKSTDKVNVSRLSVMTGVHRKDVTEIFKEKRTPFRRAAPLLTRVLGQWEQDKRFLTKAGKPRVLNFKGKENDFRNLVETVSKNLNPGTVLFELERAGAIERTKGGVKLCRVAHPIGDDPRKRFTLLSRNVESLINAAEENLFSPKAIKNLHARTEYDNVFRADVPEVREWIYNEGKSFHKKVRDYLSQFDEDVSPDPDKEGGAFVVVGSYSYTVED